MTPTSTPRRPRTPPSEAANKPAIRAWIETVRLLIDAGASREGLWISSKPPSQEVAEVLRQYGITPDEPDEPPQSGDRMERPGLIATGVMAVVARHLEAAYRDEDPDLLGSLLHPDVTWTGLCHNRAQVLDWYRGFQADRTIAKVNGLEVDRDAVVLGLSVSRHAEGARPVPPQQLYQVFDGRRQRDRRHPLPPRPPQRARPGRARRVGNRGPSFSTSSGGGIGAQSATGTDRFSRCGPDVYDLLPSRR